MPTQPHENSLSIFPLLHGFLFICLPLLLSMVSCSSAVLFHTSSPLRSTTFALNTWLGDIAFNSFCSPPNYSVYLPLSSLLRLPNLILSISHCILHLSSPLPLSHPPLLRPCAERVPTLLMAISPPLPITTPPNYTVTSIALNYPYLWLTSAWK